MATDDHYIDTARQRNSENQETWKSIGELARKLAEKQADEK